MSDFIELDCGCRFKTDGEDKESDNLPSIQINTSDFKLDCPATWELLKRGNTKGIFQLEGNLGQHWSKEIEPENISDVGAISSLLRPGCLQSKSTINGETKSMTQWYADRKTKKTETIYEVPALKEILSETYGVIVYQEQAIRIAREIAGYSLQEADKLRKAIGKKDEDLMAEIKGPFVNGCEKTGIVTREEGEKIFNWIRQSSRYSFNKSHAIQYAYVSYWTAYIKTHFPVHYYTSWLYFARDKQKPKDEIKELVEDAYAQDKDITIRNPDIGEVFYGDKGRFNLKNNQILYGITDIKGIGDSVFTELIEHINEAQSNLKKLVIDFSWYEFLVNIAHKSNKTVIEALIGTGALDRTKKSRKRMLLEYSKWNELSKTEVKWCIENKDNYTDLIQLIEGLLASGVPQKRRIEKVTELLQILSSSRYNTNESINWISNMEEALLGVPISVDKFAEIEEQGDTTCREIQDGKMGNVTVLLELTDRREWKIKNGKNKGKLMGKLAGRDRSGKINDIVCFTESWKQNADKLVPGNIVLIDGYINQPRNLTINNVKHCG